MSTCADEMVSARQHVDLAVARVQTEDLRAEYRRAQTPDFLEHPAPTRRESEVDK